MTRHAFFDASLADADGRPAWWSARHIVAFDDDTPVGDPTTLVVGTIVQDLDPVESGLDEIHGRYGTDWSPAQERIVLRGRDLLKEVSEPAWAAFRAGRHQYRIDHGLPRYVVRSDVRDQDTSERRPLHALVHPWPVDTFTQAGSVRRDGRRLVFLEFFPTDPSTYMRAEAPTAAEAEDRLWKSWSRYLACADHTYEARGYRNGLGFCTGCGLATSKAFTPEELGLFCTVCGVGTFHDCVEFPDGTKHQVCAAHTPPSYGAFDAHLLRDEHEMDVNEPVDAAALALVRERLPSGQPWTGLDFNSRWSIIRDVRVELLRHASNGNATG